MKKSMNQALAAILLFSATVAMAQQTMMDGMKGMSMGKVVKVDANAGVVTVAHGPIKSLSWPAMTMGFQVRNKMLLDKLAVGKTVDFEFAQVKGAVLNG